MSSNYQGETPSLTIDARIPAFFARFYAVSDDPSEQSHVDYANSLTKNATLIMGIKEAKGYDNILEFRKGLWTGPVKTRQHRLSKIFPFGDNSNEVMLYGTVDYELKNEKKVTVQWAGRALLVEDGGKLKMGFYQVYMVRMRNALRPPTRSVLTIALGFCSRRERDERLNSQISHGSIAAMIYRE